MNRSTRGWVAFAGAGALVAAAYGMGALEFLEGRLIDARFRVLRHEFRPMCTVVAIDATSLRTLDAWPWPRGYHASVLENLLAAGAERVVFDVDFSSRSDEEQDAELAGALKAAGSRAVLPVFRRPDTGMQGGRLVASAPLPLFRDGPQLASITVRPERDGIVRRYAVSEPFEAAVVPTLAASLAATGGSKSDPFWIDFALAPSSIPTLSYVDVLAGHFDRSAVAGRAVIIGGTAAELGDQSAVPISTTLPGPILQALATESLAQGRALRRSDPLATIAATLAVALLLGTAFDRLSWRLGMILAACGLGGVYAGGLAIQSVRPMLADLAPPMTAIVAVYGTALARRVDLQGVRLALQGLRLRGVERDMRHVVDNSFDAILTLDHSGSVLTFNAAAERLFGRSAEDALGRPASELLELDTELAPGPVRTARARRGPTRGIPVELAISEVAGEALPRRVVFARDITEREAHREALEHSARHDVLTGLPNRLLLAERLDAALRGGAGSGGSVAVLLLDLDRFKEINDALGHPMGDLVLREAAARLRAAVAARATIARLGGDEFAAILPAASEAKARELAQDLLRALVAPFPVRGLELRVEASVGIALFPQHGATAADLLQRADIAMYSAKRARSGAALYAAADDERSLRNLVLNGDLGRAIDDGTLVLHYMVKRAARSRAVAGVEALLRWRHARFGAVGPDEFVPLAEQSGLIQPLTRWVLAEAARRSAAWSRDGFPVATAINLSARNLLDPSLPAEVERTCRKNGVVPGAFVFEITETALMEDPARALGAAHALVGMGARLSIDDFGTGYSSLGYLKRLPVAELKIDKSFVLGMDTDRDNATIVASTIGLAHDLGLTVVAEGVETESIWAQLEEMGCDYGQGWLFGRPAPGEEVAGLLAEGASLHSR